MTLVFGNTLKYIFTGHNSQSGRGPEIEHGEHRKLRKLTSSLLENPKTPQKFVIIPKLRDPLNNETHVYFDMF